VDSLVCFIHVLSEKYAKSDDNARLTTMTELLKFTRHAQEGVNEMVTRFEQFRTKERAEEKANTGIQSTVWLLLRACQLDRQQLAELLQPYDGLLPADVVQYAAMITQLRQMDYVKEKFLG